LVLSFGNAAIPEILAILSPPPRHFPVLVVNKALVQFDPWVTLGWPLRDAWVTLG
jgi:hypothetical protein